MDPITLLNVTKWIKVAAYLTYAAFSTPTCHCAYQPMNLEVSTTDAIRYSSDQNIQLCRCVAEPCSGKALMLLN